MCLPLWGAVSLILSYNEAMAAAPSVTSEDAFPAPVTPPREARLARAGRERELLRAAWLGIGLRLSVIALELAGVWFLGYAALLVDAVASVFDVAASLAIVLAIRLAARPPDDEHPFGHGRYEPLAGLQLGLLVCAAGLWLSVRFLFGAVDAPAAGVVHPFAWCIPAAAAVILEISARIVTRMGSGRRARRSWRRGFITGSTLRPASWPLSDCWRRASSRSRGIASTWCAPHCWRS